MMIYSSSVSELRELSEDELSTLKKYAELGMLSEKALKKLNKVK